MSKPKPTEKAKRLTPTPEVLRELYLLSGNNCAIADCNHVIIDGKGVIVGHICHIEAAMPYGPRFNKNQTNEQRRELSNLLLLCSGHHAQIDSKKYEKDWPAEKVRKIKSRHEAKYKGIAGSLEKAFISEFVDTTDSLNQSVPQNFKRLEATLSICKIEKEYAQTRAKHVEEYIEQFSKVPTAERDFMLSVIRRAIKLGNQYDNVSVHVDDLTSALRIGQNKLKKLGDAMERYGVGSITEVSTPYGTEEYHVRLQNPSDYISWIDIAEFCTKTGVTLEEFVIDLKFGLLDS